MKLRSIFLAVFTLWTGGLFAQTAQPTTVAGRPVLWSVHFDAERLRTGPGQELFASLEPWLKSLSGEKSSSPAARLESLTVVGFKPQKGSDDPFPLLADLGFSGDNGGISPRFEAIRNKRSIPTEDLAGHPAMHFEHQGKEVWIVKLSDRRVCVSTSRGLLETALATGASPFASSLPPPPGEMLGGSVEIEPLLADNPALRDSELLKLLPSLEFHLLSAGGALNLDASAQLDSERSAKRAARMINGMAAMVSMQDTGGVPWDERLVLKQDGAVLAMHLHLEAQEAKKLFDSFARQIEDHTTATNDGE